MSRHSTSAALEASEVERKKAEATPDLHEWKKQFGDKVKVDERTGEFSIKLTDRQEIRRAHEMQEAARRIDVERGEELHSRHENKREKVVRRDGKVVELE